MASFEKNPEKKVTPLNLTILIKFIIVILLFSVLLNVSRKSCWENREWIRLPTIVKRFALAKACIIKWKKQTKGPPINKVKIINPSCLKVESATNFFPSDSLKAVILATSKVTMPKINLILMFNIVNCPNRIKIQIPAVTSVELCTSALTGVGAAIAAGSHLIKGNWALFVIATKKNNKNNRLLEGLFISNGNRTRREYPRTTNKIASPDRLVKRVRRPPFALDQFW